MLNETPHAAGHESVVGGDVMIPSRDLPRLSEHIAKHGNADGFVRTPAKRRKNIESEMQRALIKWWQMACRGFGVPEILLFSIPNGGGGGEKRGHWLKLEGCRKGVPDLMLAVPQTDRNQGRTDDECHAEWLPDIHGLFLELKTTTGRLSPEQEVYHQRLSEAGYKVVVCRSLDECKKVITEYLS